MRDAGLIEFRRHYPDVVGQRAGDLLDDFQAGSMDAVVIGAENAHPFKCLLRSIPPAVRAPSYPSHAVEANPAKMEISRRVFEGGPLGMSDYPRGIPSPARIANVSI